MHATRILMLVAFVYHILLYFALQSPTEYCRMNLNDFDWP